MSLAHAIVRFGGTCRDNIKNLLLIDLVQNGVNRVAF